MDPLVDTIELERRFPEAKTDEERAQALLEDASAVIRAAGNSGWTSTSVPASVVPIVIGVVIRAWTNPAGLSDEQVGTYAVTYASSGGVYLLPDEVAAIQRGAGRTGLHTVSTTRTDPATGVPDVPSVLPCYPNGATPVDVWSHLGEAGDL